LNRDEKIIRRHLYANTEKLSPVLSYQSTLFATMVSQQRDNRSRLCGFGPFGKRLDALGNINEVFSRRWFWRKKVFAPHLEEKARVEWAGK
jgi:hypothetical protein